MNQPTGEACISCGGSNRRKMARRLCSRCYSNARRHGFLDDYPRVYWIAEDMLHDWAELRARGYTWRHAAERIGVKPSTLDRALARAKRRGDERGCRSIDDLKAWRKSTEKGWRSLTDKKG